MKKYDVYQVFDSKFNKDDMYQNIMNKLKMKKRKQIVIKYSFACILLILIVSGLFISKNMFCDKEVDKQDVVKDKIYINEIDNTMYDDVSNLDVLVLDTSHSTYAMQPLSIQIPSDLKLDTIYIVYVRNEQTGKYDIVHDIIDSYIGDDKRVNVAYSSVGEVLRDMDIPKGNLSIIEGIEVMISKDEQRLIGQFKYQSVYYDIESFGLTIDEFLNIIKSIIE